MRSARSKAPLSSLAARVMVPAVVACVAVLAAAAWLLPGLGERAAIAQVEASATRLARSLSAQRTHAAAQGLYRRLDGTGSEADGRSDEPVIEAHAVPLPENDLDGNGAHVRLYSAHPFPWREAREHDAFERRAMRHLSENPASTLHALRSSEGRTIVRAAVADTMSAQACASCHNAHPLSPETGWQLGDMRGVLEVAVSADAALGQARRTVNVLLMALALTLLALLAGLAGALRLFVSEPFRIADRTLQQLADGDTSAPPRGLNRLATERSDAGRLARRASAVLTGMRDLRKQLDERRRDELEKAAWVDSQTGQSVHGQFERQLGQALALAKRHNGTLALLLIHVDGIERTQVEHGREFADAQRKALSLRIGESLRESDDLAQLTLVEGEDTFVEPPEGGDDFVVLLREAGGPDDVAAVVGRMLAALGAPVNVHGHSLGGVISIGIGMCPRARYGLPGHHPCGRCRAARRPRRGRALLPPHPGESHQRARRQAAGARGTRGSGR